MADEKERQPNVAHTQPVAGTRRDAGDPDNSEADTYIEEGKAAKKARLQEEREVAIAGAREAGETHTPRRKKTARKK